MPKLLQSIVSVIEVFYQYATNDEECAMLNKGEMKVFLENEFHQIMKVRYKSISGLKHCNSLLLLFYFLSHISNS